MSEEVKTPPADDEELWAAFVDGDDEALRELARRYRDELFWYLLLSTGTQQAAAQHLMNVWDILARYRRPYEGFDSFRSWLYAVATQNSVPATHPEPLGLMDLIGDLKRGKARTRRGRLFFHLTDLTRAVRQPFLLATVGGLNIEETAAVCNFTRRKTEACLRKACRFLRRSGLFEGEADEV
ncbi:MAG: hypothetical protein R6X33_19660 [Candidatus Brocadiia bacterium]